MFVTDADARGEIKFNVKGEVAGFDGENNSGKTRVIVDSLFIQPPIKNIEQDVHLELESDNQLTIKQFAYRNFGDNILFDSKTFSNISKLKIESDSLLINPNTETTVVVYSDDFSIEGGTHNLAFPNTNNLKIIIPKGSTEYLLKFPEDSRVWINEFEITPVEGWKQREVTMELISIGGRVMNIEKEHFVMTNWKKLTHDSLEPLDLTLYDIDGKIGIDEPREIPLELSLADDLKFSGLTGEFVIERLENTFKVSSRGFAEIIEINEKNILEEEWLFSTFVNQNLGPIAILLTIGVSIFPFFKWVYPKIRRRYGYYRFKKAIDDGSYAKMMDDFEDHLNS